MEFKSLNNIETSFRQIRLFALVFICLCALVTGFAVWNSYSFAEKQRQKIYVLDNGKSLMLDLSEKGYYNRVISGNINQTVEIDSMKCDFDQYPYRVDTYARQLIVRESSLTVRSLVTTCRLLNATRSDNNPHGFIMEAFTITENKDLQTIKR